MVQFPTPTQFDLIATRQCQKLETSYKSAQRERLAKTPEVWVFNGFLVPSLLFFGAQKKGGKKYRQKTITVYRENDAPPYDYGAWPPDCLSSLQPLLRPWGCPAPPALKQLRSQNLSQSLAGGRCWILWARMPIAFDTIFMWKIPMYMTSEDVCPESEEGDQNQAGGLNRIWHVHRWYQLLSWRFLSFDVR